MRAAAMALTLALAFDAHAYVRSRTKHGTAVYWPGACIFLQPDSDGSPDLPLTAVDADVQQSIDNWQSVTSACAYIAIHKDDPAKLEAHLDGINVVKFRTDKWCHPEDSQNHNVCYASAAAAITTVFYLDRPGDAQDGYIIDSDVELNNLNFTFVDVVQGQPLPSPRMGTSIADLKNTLTHEFGHVQGLDHTCADSATPANEVDENGNPPPACNMLATLSSADVRKLARWYIDVLGLHATELSDGWADLGSVALHSGGRKRTRDCGHKLVFYAKDVTRARGRLVKRGAELGPVRKLGALHLCDGRDPEGNVFQISNR